MLTFLRNIHNKENLGILLFFCAHILILWYNSWTINFTKSPVPNTFFAFNRKIVEQLLQAKTYLFSFYCQ